MSCTCLGSNVLTKDNNLVLVDENLEDALSIVRLIDQTLCAGETIELDELGVKGFSMLLGNLEKRILEARNKLQ
ncbi:MAG: hypothetical protein K6L75_02420 [Cellvibrionaceae bacterium]